jgi:hypothetical protein
MSYGNDAEQSAEDGRPYNAGIIVVQLEGELFGVGHCESCPILLELCGRPVRWC